MSSIYWDVNLGGTVYSWLNVELFVPNGPRRFCPLSDAKVEVTVTRKYEDDFQLSRSKALCTLQIRSQIQSFLCCHGCTRGRRSVDEAVACSAIISRHIICIQFQQQRHTTMSFGICSQHARSATSNLYFSQHDASFYYHNSLRMMPQQLLLPKKYI